MESCVDMSKRREVVLEGRRSWLFSSRQERLTNDRIHFWTTES